MHRELASLKHDWYESLNESSMTATVEYENDDGDIVAEQVACVFQVCPTCEGRGKHVNPSIDSQGIPAQDFYDDPEFAQDYFNGVYDVTCYECHGRRVVVEPDWANLSENLKRRVEERIRDEASYARERAYELRMGY